MAMEMLKDLYGISPEITNEAFVWRTEDHYNLCYQNDLLVPETLFLIDSNKRVSIIVLKSQSKKEAFKLYCGMYVSGFGFTLISDFSKPNCILLFYFDCMCSALHWRHRS